MNQTSCTVLIINGSPEERERYGRYLLGAQNYSFTIVEATLGREGLELWQQHKPDAVLLDDRLPDMDGLEFLAQLQPLSQQRYLPVIMVSGRGNEAMKAGAQNYLVKEQITPERLNQAVNGAIETVQLRIQLQQRIGADLLLAQITQKIHQTLDLEEILQTTVIEVRQFLQTDRVLIFRLESEGWGTITTESVADEWTPLLSTSLHDPCLNEKYLESFRQGLITRKSDIYDSSIDPCHIEFLAQLQVKANLVVPIIKNSQLWGMLIAHHCAAPRQWQQLEVDLLKQITTHLGIALQQAELYQQAQNELAQRNLAENTEEALRENEQLLRLALKGAKAGSYDWDLQRNKLVWSLETFELYGLDPVNGVPEYQDWYATVHPDDREYLNTEISHMLDQRLPEIQVEFRIVHPQRGIIWLLSLGSLMLNEQGEPVRLSGINLDISDRKQSQLALQERERQFTTLAEASPTAIFKCDTANNCIYVNPRWCEMTGQPAEVAFGMGWVQTVHPDDRDAIVSAWREWCAHSQERKLFQLEGRCMRPDGSIIYYICQALAEINDEGIVVGYIGILIDISDRKQVEEALRQSEERYRCLAELIPQLIWTASPEGELLDVNHRFLEFTGFVMDEVTRPVKNLLVHPEDLPVVTQIWNESLQQGTYYLAEGRIRRADGVYLWHLNQAIPQKNQQGEIVKWFGTLTDIEAQKQLEIERDRLLQLEQTARAEAERANRIKDDFLAILSHELRSPLNPILGWTKMLQTGRFDEARTAAALATIERNVKLQTQLIDDLLDVAKILHGKLNMDFTPVNLAVVIESALDTVTTTAIAKSILLHPVVPNIGQVPGDSTRLQQIVWNLLSNAIKFTPNGGRVEVRLEQVNDYAHIIVSDTGKGINPDFLPHIFETFRQEDVSTTRKHGGLGLGLAIVRQLVEAHGGTIIAQSPGEGLGATFTVRLRLLNVPPTIKQTDELRPKALDLSGIRVLTVDDDPDTRELLAVLLTEYGAQVLTVGSGAEVMVSLESFQPHVLVSDIGMPNIDGYNLIQQIRTLPPEKGGRIPAIALTAYARVDDHQRAITSGYQRHVKKPLEPTELVEAVMALVHIQG